MISGSPRFATEKAVFRPALGMSLMPGISEMQMNKPYIEKLRDPRWQKKRLEALNAAQWTCASCSDKDSTLHVHHRQYFKGREPWEYEVGQLEVLCEDCHSLHHEQIEPDPLMLAASFVPSSGTWNRDSAASLIAGFCRHDINADYVGDPGTFMVGSVARVIEQHGLVMAIAELAEVLGRRDKWTIRAAMSDFIKDLNTRADVPPPLPSRTDL